MLNAVAERAGWGKPAPQGVYRGLAQTMGFGSYVAACAEVSVDDNGELKIHRIVAATDPRPRRQPAADRGAGRGLVRLRPVGRAVRRLHGEGRAHRADNFNTYPVLRMDEMPKVETIVMPSGGFWGGVGEPTIAVAAPAVLNAIFAGRPASASRSVPMRDQGLGWPETLI